MQVYGHSEPVLLCNGCKRLIKEPTTEQILRVDCGVPACGMKEVEQQLLEEYGPDPK